MRKILLLASFLFTTNDIDSQNITYLRVIPNSPSEFDTVSVVYQIVFPWADARKLSSYQESNSDTLNYYACFFQPGMFQSDTYIEDTILWGKLDPGVYKFRLTRKIVWFVNDTFCDNIAYSVYLDTPITVSRFNSLSPDKLILNNAFATLHPNPASTTITLSGAPPQSAATITNLQGQVVAESEIQHSPYEISVAHLPPGMYFCMVQSGGQRKVLRFVRE